jgi:hypothetical protein
MILVAGVLILTLYDRMIKFYLRFTINIFVSMKCHIEVCYRVPGDSLMSYDG